MARDHESIHRDDTLPFGHDEHRIDLGFGNPGSAKLRQPRQKPRLAFVARRR